MTRLWRVYKRLERAHTAPISKRAELAARELAPEMTPGPCSASTAGVEPVAEELLVAVAAAVGVACCEVGIGVMLGMTEVAAVVAGLVEGCPLGHSWPELGVTV